MFMDFWCEIYESVKRKPSRTILTGIGISWGIFILIVLVGIGSGFERGVFKLFNGFSKSTTYVYASETSMGYKGAASGRKIQFQKEVIRIYPSHLKPAILRAGIDSVPTPRFGRQMGYLGYS